MLPARPQREKKSKAPLAAKQQEPAQGGGIRHDLWAHVCIPDPSVSITEAGLQAGPPDSALQGGTIGEDSELGVSSPGSEPHLPLSGARPALFARLRRRAVDVSPLSFSFFSFRKIS